MVSQVPACSGSGLNLPVFSPPVVETTPQDFTKISRELKRIALRMEIALFSVHRRLAESGRFSGLGSAKNEFTSQASSTSWLVSEPGRVRACPQTGIPVSRVHVRLVQGSYPPEQKFMSLVRVIAPYLLAV